MNAPKFPSFFKTGKYSQPRSFEFKPRFYDEDKERLEKRRREIEAEVAAEERRKASGEYQAHLRSRIADSWHREAYRKSRSNSTFRLLVILAGLLFLCYYFFLKS